MTTHADSIHDTKHDSKHDTTRRRALQAIALGGAGALVLNDTALAGDSAGEATGGNAVELGVIDNTSDAPTGIRHSGGLTDYSALTVWEDDPAEIGTNVFPAAIGGYGSTGITNGVHGSTTNVSGYGVVAANVADAATDEEVAPAALAVASANGAQIKFVPLGTPVSGPTPGVHVPGELYVDKDGALWFTVPDSTAETETGDETDAEASTEAEAVAGGARFVKLAGSATAGALHPLAFPVRVYDTRSGDVPAKAAADSISEVDLTLKLDGTPSGLPAGATAALLNLTIADSDEKGFFAVAASGVETPEAEVFSNGNWTQAGTNLGTSVTTAVSVDGKITVTLGPEGGTHLIVDVVGYYA